MCMLCAGSALVKYGSLFLDAPFQPSVTLALGIIAAPCVVFAVFLAAASKKVHV